MSDSRDESGNFEEGHTDGPSIGTDERLDPSKLAWRCTRIRIMNEYPAAWEKYAVETGEIDE